MTDRRAALDHTHIYYIASDVPGCPACAAAQEAVPLYGDVERLLIGMVRTSYPMDRDQYEKGWNEALHAARKRVTALAADTAPLDAAWAEGLDAAARQYVYALETLDADDPDTIEYRADLVRAARIRPVWRP